MTAHDPQAFEALYKRFAPMAFRRASRLLREQADAREVVQDLFVSLLDRPEQYRGRDELTGFIYRAVTNACLNVLRNRRTQLRLLQERRQELQPAAHALARQDIWSTLQSELENMPESLARVAIYYYMDELTHDEIATLVGYSPRKVGTQIAQLAGWSKRSGAA